MFFVALALLALAGAWFVQLWRREWVSGIVITPLLVFVALFSIFLVPAAIAASVPSQSDDSVPLLIVAFAAFAFLAGFSYFGDNQRIIREFAAREPSVDPADAFAAATSRQYLRAVLATAGVLTLIGLFWLQGFPPIFQNVRDLFGGSVDADQLYESSLDHRLLTTKIAWFGGEDRGQGFLGPISRYGWPFLLVVAIFFYSQARPKSIMRKNWLRTIVLIGILGFAFVGGNFTRHPLLGALLTVLIALSFLRPLKLRTTAIFGGIAVLTLVLLSISSHKAVRAIGDTGLIAEKLTNRVFFANGANDIATVELLRSGAIDHRWGGEHVRQALSAVPGVRIGTPFAYELHTTLNPRSEKAVNATGTYYSLLYLDFGEIGVPLGFLLLGLGVGWSYPRIYAIYRREEDRAVAVTMVYLAGHTVFAGPVALVSSTVALGITYLILRGALNLVGRPEVRPRNPIGVPSIRQRQSDLPWS